MKPPDSGESVPRFGTNAAAEATTMLKELVEAVAPLASVTMSVTGNVPVAEGVPEIKPPVESESPAGSELEVETSRSAAPPPVRTVKEYGESKTAERFAVGVVRVNA